MKALLAAIFAVSMLLHIQASPIKLDVASLDKTISESEYVLVNFYTYWSQPSQVFGPIYEEVAKELNGIVPDLKVVNVDVTQDIDVAEKYNILTFPTIKLFIKGAKKPIHYTGDKTASEVIEWSKIKVSGKISREIVSQEQLDDIVGNTPLVVVFLGSSESKAYEDYIEAMRHYNHIVTVHSDNEEIRKRYNVEKEGLLIFKENGREILKSKNELNFDGIRRFMNGQIYPAVTPFDDQIRHRIFEDAQDVVILVTSQNHTDTNVEEIFSQIAEELKEKVGFSVAKVGTNLEVKMFDVIKMSIPQIFEVSNDELPMVGIIKVQDRMKKYFMEGEITKENIKNFVEKYLENKVKAYLQSGPIPTEEYDGDVRVLVGKTFNGVVYDNEKDVLVSFCSEKKNNCQVRDVAKIVARRMKDRENLVVAKMDTFANNVEVMENFNTPALVLFPKGNKEKFVMYKGFLNDLGVMAFIDENTSASQEEAEIILNENYSKEAHLHADL